MPTMDNQQKLRLIKEIRFFAIVLVGYVAFYFLLGSIIGKGFSQQSFFETMVVAVLVSYLIRFVFIVMRNLK